MILKGSQRAGGTDLATHLLNEFDNDRIEIGEIRGTVANDLHGAFAEYEAVAAGTRCRKALYSLSINPPEALTREQYVAAIDRIEERLGLAGQPRAVVFHVKHGRAHCHVVWSRVDAASLRAVHISHDRQKLRAAARELAREFGLPLPDGLARDHGAERSSKADLTLAEKMQAEATGVTPQERRAAITQAYRNSDSAEAFRAALKAQGYILARGDRRGFVVVDRYGQVHSLARQIDGARTRDVKAKLASLNPDRIPDVEQARASIREREKITEKRMRERTDARMMEHAGRLNTMQAARRAKLTARRQELEVQHRAERLSLHAAHKSEAGKPFARAASMVFGLFDRLPVLRSVIGPLRRNPNINPAERHRLEREALARRHAREMAMMDRRSKDLALVEARERLSLGSKLRRRVRLEEIEREQRSLKRYDDIEVNKLDITVAGRGADRAKATETPAGKETWKSRKDKLTGKHGPRRSRPAGYRIGRDQP